MSKFHIKCVPQASHGGVLLYREDKGQDGDGILCSVYSISPICCSCIRCKVPLVHCECYCNFIESYSILVKISWTNYDLKSLSMPSAVKLIPSIAYQGAGKRPRQCCHPKGGNGAEGPRTSKAKCPSRCLPVLL